MKKSISSYITSSLNYYQLVVITVLALPSLLYADYQNTLYLTTAKSGNVPFEHLVHLQKLNNNCSSCHNSIFHVVRSKNSHATMADMEQGKSCGSCHNKDNPRIPQLNACSTCHPVSEVSINIPDFGAVVFSHNKHLGMFTCTDCHDALFRTTRDNPHVTMLQMAQGKSCGSCHDGKTAFSVTKDCTKCHEVGNITMPGDSVFSHPKHLEMSFSCSDCHPKLFVPGANRKHFSMLEMEKQKSCGNCHDGNTAFSVKGDCQKCHKTVKDVAFKAFNARFNHSNHLKMFGCSDCHSSIVTGGANSIRYSMSDMEKGKSCGACHDGKTAFTVNGSCDKCHISFNADISFKIKDVGQVIFSHQKHRDMFGCNECHNGKFKTGAAAKRFSMSEMNKGEACGACHDSKTAFGLKNCSKCHPVKDVLFSDDARFSHNKHLEIFSCSDCHSQLYVASSDNKRYTMSQIEKGASCGSCHDGTTAFSSKGDCDKCHKSTVNVIFKVKETGNTTFSHTIHSSMYKCTDCHNSIFAAGKTSKRFTMAEMEKGASCGTCHDGKTAFTVTDTCQKCHPVKQIQFKPGSAVFNHSVHVTSYSCKECHPDIFVPGSGNRRMSMAQMEQGKSCGACHDDKTAFSVSSNCQKCHPGTPKTIRYELSQNTGNVEFSHKPHSDRGYGCSDCHYSVIPSGTADKRWVMKEMDQGKFCGTCHGYSMAFSVKDPASCERCHQKESDWRPQPML